MKLNIQKLLSNNLLMLFSFLAGGSIFCIISRHENAFDFMNYHYYNAFAFFNDRMNFDIAPASLQGFFNPLIEFPLYWLIQYFNDQPAIIYAFQGLWFGGLLFMFFKICCMFFDISTTKGLISVALSLAFAATGQVTWSQAGTSTNEITVSFFNLISLYILLKMYQLPDTQKLWKFVVSGLILGATLGLKSTTIIVCVASGATLILTHRRLSHPVAFIIAFAFAGLFGWLLTNGWWAYRLYELYGNPFFPFLNKIFQSPYFENFNYTDTRFIPPLAMAPFCPYVATLLNYCNADGVFYDIRYPLYYTISVILLIRFLLRPQQLKQQLQKPSFEFFLYLFMLIEYILWVKTFSIIRYIVILEMFGAIIFVKAMLSINPQSTVKLIFYGTLCTITCYILLSVPANNPAWSNRVGLNKFIETEPVNLPPNSLIKLYGIPLSGIIPQIDKDNNARALGYFQHTNNGVMRGSDLADHGKFREMRDKIEQEHQGPVIIFFRATTNPAMFLPFFRALRPDIKGKKCRPFKNNIHLSFIRTIQVCVDPQYEDIIFPKAPTEKDIK